MSAPKIGRNFEIIKKRLTGSSWRSLQKEYKFKSHSTVQDIYKFFIDSFLAKYPKYKEPRTYPQKKT